MSVTVYTGLGAVADVPVTFTAPTGTTQDQVQVAIGTWDAPSDFLTPQAVTINGTTVTASLRIGQGHLNPVAGTYWLWWQVTATDGEVLIGRSTSRFITTDTGGIPIADVSTFVLDGGTP